MMIQTIKLGFFGEVDRLMRDVHIATQDEFTLGLQAQQVRVELGQEAKLGLLPLGAR